jgi:hypothetical protein
MSWVTNVILHLGPAFIAGAYEKRLLAKVNHYFLPGNGLVSVDDDRLPSGWYGGNKGLEVSLAIGAFNNLDLERFVTHLRTIDWPSPESVQLIVREQEDDRFRIVNIFEHLETSLMAE